MPSIGPDLKTIIWIDWGISHLLHLVSKLYSIKKPQRYPDRIVLLFFIANPI